MRSSTAVVTTDVPNRRPAIKSDMDLASAAPHKYSRCAGGHFASGRHRWGGFSLVHGTDSLASTIR
jgi:hypothetical protein